MSRIYICLVSEQTIPNVLVACHYKPDSIWFITTKKMEDEKKTECIKNTLRLKGVLTEMKTVIEKIVDQDSLMAKMNSFKYFQGKDP